MRVYEYAKQNNLTSKEVLEKLKVLNIDISNHMSTISTDIMEKLDHAIKNKDKKKAKPKTQEKRQKQNKSKPKQKKTPSKKQTRKEKKKMTYSGTITVSELAERLQIDTSEIIKNLMFLGVMATKNQDLDDDAIELICEEFGVEVEKEIILDDTDLDI